MRVPGIVFAAVLVGVAAPRAHADAITLVTNGYVQTSGVPPVWIVDFQLFGRGFSAVGEHDTTLQTFAFVRPGERVNLSKQVNETFGNFNVGELALWAKTNFTFEAGEVIAPSIDDLLSRPSFTIDVSSPFTLFGTLQAFGSRAELESGAAPAFSRILAGRGTATETFALPVQEGTPVDSVRRNQTFFAFESSIAPTPEPAAMLLVAAGLTMAGVSARRRKTSNDGL